MLRHIPARLSDKLGVLPSNGQVLYHYAKYGRAVSMQTGPGRKWALLPQVGRNQQVGGATEMTKPL